MREQDLAFVAWRERAHTVLDDGRVAELEDHLRCCVADELTRGADPESAFASAERRLGSPIELARAFPSRGFSMQRVSRWIGLAACALLVIAALGSRASLASFVDVRGLAPTAGLTLGGLWASFGLRRPLAAIACAVRGSADERQRSAARPVLERGYVLAWSSGALACLLGVLVELSALESPPMLASGVARASLSVLYGALLAEIVFANWKHWLAEEPASARF